MTTFCNYKLTADARQRSSNGADDRNDSGSSELTLATLAVWLVTDRAGQPLPGMDARLSWEKNSAGDQIILLHPRTDAERGYERFVGAVSLRTARNQHISGKAQIIVSSSRILGMVIDGVAAGEPIGVDAGIVLVFTVPNHELARGCVVASSR